MMFTKTSGKINFIPKIKISTNFFLILLIKFTTGKLWQNQANSCQNIANPEEKKFPKIQILDRCFWRPYQRLARFCRVAGPMEFYRRKWIFHHFLQFRHYQGIIQALFHRRRPSLWSTNGVINLGIFGHALVRCQSTS